MGNEMNSNLSLNQWFRSGVAYIDPNDHGPMGYVLIAFLLLLYEKVVVHSPFAGKILTANAALPPELRPLILPWSELRKLVIEPECTNNLPLIRITAFPTYVDRGFNDKCSVERCAIKGVDDERLDSKSELYRSLAIVEYDPRAANAKSAIDFAQEQTLLKAAEQKLSSRLLPHRFQLAQSGVDFYCPSYLGVWWKTASEAQRLVSLSVYDFLNDRAAISCGGGNVHCLAPRGELAAEMIFSIENPPFFPHNYCNTLQSKMIEEILSALSTEIPLVQLDANFIRTFRRRYRDDFINDFAEVLEGLCRIDVSADRIQIVRDRVRSVVKLDRFPIMFGKSIDVILALIDPLTLGFSKILFPSLEKYIQTRLPELDPSRRSRWRYALRGNRVNNPWVDSTL